MGMLVVALLAANVGSLPVATIESTLRRTSSAASSGRRSVFPSANRYSMILCFSFNPSEFAQLLPERVHVEPHYHECFDPGNLCGGFWLVAAREATAPPRANVKAIAEVPTHFGFWIFDFPIVGKRIHRKCVHRFVLPSIQNQNRKSKILLDHLVCSHQHVRWNREADLLRRFKIDDQLKLGRLLNRSRRALRL